MKPAKIATTKPEKTVKARIAELVISEAMQPRSKVNQDAINRYRLVFQNGGVSPFPPILVARITDQPDARGCLTVIDGFHRVRAASLAQVERIDARVVEMTHAEALWQAAMANLKHGLPLSGKDTVEVFKRYVWGGKNVDEKGELKSYAGITADLGGMRSKQTLHRWMTRYFPAVAARMAGREEIEEPMEPAGDNATAAERHLRDYVEGAVRMIGGMAKDQRRAVEQSAKNSGMTSAEKDRRAEQHTQAAVLGALWPILRAAEEALGMTARALLEAGERAEAESDSGDF